MPAAVDFDLKQLVLLNGTFGPREVKQIATAISDDSGQLQVLRDAVNELLSREEQTPASNVRLGVCLFLLGRYYRAIEVLRKGDGGALALFFLAKALLARQRFAEAVECYESAEKAGYETGACALGRAEALRYDGRPQEALAVLDQLSGAIEQTADYLAQRAATVAAIGGNKPEVIALYERAVEIDGQHPAALFGLACENDRHGNDDTAMELYRRAVARYPSHVGSLLNLGVLYEDREQYDKAAQCYRKILDTYPDHARAALYFKDTEASHAQFYDEDAQKKRDRMSQVLSVPVTDFELSVRSRNCLQKMGIMTLGDLCRCTEQELLSSKNFGETSLAEIRDMLASKGLRLGQLLQEQAPVDVFEPQTLSADEQAMVHKPVSELNLSVRARKCMIRLGISTIGDLLRKTGDDLLECKNFGVTSLNEVREKLTQAGLKLRGE